MSERSEWIDGEADGAPGVDAWHGGYRLEGATEATTYLLDAHDTVVDAAVAAGDELFRD